MSGYASWAPISNGPSITSSVGRPCEPRTSEASSGITSSSVRNPSARLASRVATASLGTEGRVDEQFDRIVSRLAVDIDRAGKIGRPGVVQPMIPSEPRIVPGHGDEFPGSFVVEAGGAFAVLIEHAFHARQVTQQRVCLRDAGVVAHVNVGDLMVGHGEGDGC